MIDWKAISNGCGFVSGYAFKGSDFNDDCKGVPVIKIKNIQNDFVTLGASQYIDSDILKQNYKSVNKYYVQDNEILISMTGAGSVGRVGLTAIDALALLNQRVGKFAPDEKNLNKEYLYHILTSDYFQRLLFNKGQGSGQPNLSPDEILEVEIPWPSYEDQVVIGSALNNLTKKITLLRQQNQDLEELAQTLFKRWFVEFEFPNENGEPYKSSGGKMVESELGEIPERWRVGFFNELIADSIGGDYGKEELIDDFTEETTCLRGTDLPDMKTGLPLRAPVRYIKASKLNKCKLESGDLVIEISGGTEGQSTGRAIYINDDILSHFDRPMTCVNFCRILRPQEKVYSYFTYLFIDHLYRHRVFFNLENGSTGIKNLDLKTLLNDYEIQLPINNLILRFDSVVNKNFVKIQRNNKEIQTLTQLRDTLLPKLMSGELRVKM